MVRRCLRLLPLAAALLLASCGGAHVHGSALPQLRLVESGPHGSRIVLRSLLGPLVGDVFTTSTGSWSRTPSSFAYQWQDCDSNGSNCVSVASGGTTNRYVVVAADVGSTLRVLVTATFSGGQTASQSSVTTGVVQSNVCTLYVSPAGGGNGSSSGSPETLTAAMGSDGPGDVVCLGTGTYNTATNFIFSHSGTQSSPITYRSYNGVPTIFFTGASLLSGGLFQTSSGTPWAGAHDIVFDGITFNAQDKIGAGVFVTQGSYRITVTNCVITSTGATGVALNAQDYATVTHNLIYDVGYGQGFSSAVSLWYGGTGATYGGPSAGFDNFAGFHNVIADNIISGTFDNSTNHTDGNGIIVDGSGSIPAALIVGNLVYQNGGRGIEDFSNSGNVWIVNNTAAEDGLDTSVGGGLAPDFMAASASNVHFVNDLAYGRISTNYATATIYNNSSSTVTWSADGGFNGSTVGTVTLAMQANPQFLSLPPVPTGATPWHNAVAPWVVGTDFELAPGSPALDAGVDATSGMNASEAAGAQPYLSTDLAGSSRGSTPNMGTY